MENRITVLLLASDDRLRREAASRLREAGCHVRTEATERSHAADVVVRDWRDERELSVPSSAVVTVDLDLLQGEELAKILARVLPRRARYGGRAEYVQEAARTASPDRFS
jgi:hypothetical protein